MSRSGIKLTVSKLHDKLRDEIGVAWRRRRQDVLAQLRAKRLTDDKNIEDDGTADVLLYQDELKAALSDVVNQAMRTHATTLSGSPNPTSAELTAAAATAPPLARLSDSPDLLEHEASCSVSYSSSYSTMKRNQSVPFQSVSRPPAPEGGPSMDELLASLDTIVDAGDEGDEKYEVWRNMQACLEATLWAQTLDEEQQREAEWIESLVTKFHRFWDASDQSRSAEGIEISEMHVSCIPCPICPSGMLHVSHGHLFCDAECWKLDMRAECMTLDHVRDQIAAVYEEHSTLSCKGSLVFSIEQWLGTPAMVARCSRCDLLALAV